ncbi:hypothetical protein BO226_17610 [Rhodococcus sp. 2G]|uniref:hypothetical protein n=1 Tax=Rhodococcus sp. 2G TaxID=1570939 RepID=UPI000903AFDE|nr:hypothetical protein [Rhodococcus sp. 2G]APE10790.1 hypothetical protein BO226_17610 [Rhodococcus sp. 2G]
MSDPTTPEGRAEMRARAERAQVARSDIARCEFLRLTPSRHSHRQVAASQSDVPALLDALDRAEDYTKANQQIVDQCVAALDRVRELTYASDDGTEYEHDHPAGQGSPECPACWATAIRRALDGTS